MIIRGTTKTLNWRFPKHNHHHQHNVTIDVNELTALEIKIKQKNEVVILKQLQDVDINPECNSFKVTLTQAETLSLSEDVDARITCRLLVASGAAMRTLDIIEKVIGDDDSILTPQIDLIPSKPEEELPPTDDYDNEEWPGQQ